MHKELLTIIATIRRYVELEELAGTGDWISSAGTAFFLQNSKIFKKKTVPVRASAEEQSSAALDSLKKEALLCDRCELCHTRTHVVFGSGNPETKLVFVGEAPGMEEDREGLPFVGRAGKLLTKIIESVGLKRSDVYIANILKCRPPDNRNPLPTEILACEEYLIRQIKIINPKVICALGKFAAQTLLRSQEPITKLRGRFYDYRGAKLMPTFHPAYLLRNPEDKRLVWEDMKMIKKEL